MNYATQRKHTIQNAFDNFHANNPRVYDEFKKLAFAAINSGKKRISFKLIMNVIRWNVFIKTNDTLDIIIDGQKVRFKINDIYGSRYARLFIKDYPQYENLVELRRLRSE